jgi:hypothetical protein
MDEITSARATANETETLRVEIHTGAYIALGIVAARQQRLIDMLGNPASPYISLESARLQPLHGTARECLGSTETLLVSRQDIRIAMPYENGSHVRNSRLHPQYVPKYPVPARICLDVMEIEGQIHIRESEDALYAAQNLNAPLVAVTQARVRYLDETHSLPFASDIVIVNRAFVQFMILRPKQSYWSNSLLDTLMAHSGTLGMRMNRAASLPR